MSSTRLSARFLQGILPRDQVRALQRAATAVTASVPNSYTWISNDAGATWLTTSPQTLTVTFFRGVDAIATQVISGARNDVTGNITLTATTHTGEAVTVTFANNGTQVASATIVHDESMAQTSVLFQSIKDGTALGGFSGGGGK